MDLEELKALALQALWKNSLDDWTFGFVRTKPGESLSASMQVRQIIVPYVRADSSGTPVPELVLD